MQFGEAKDGKDGLVETETIGCYQRSVRGGGVGGSSVARKTLHRRRFVPFECPLVNLCCLHTATKAFLDGPFLPRTRFLRHSLQVAFHA